jgi:hypothetical protein
MFLFFQKVNLSVSSIEAQWMRFGRGNSFFPVYYEESKSCTFTGICDLLATLNTFVSSLCQEKAIGHVSTSDVSSTSEETIFNLKVEFL